MKRHSLALLLGSVLFAGTAQAQIEGQAKPTGFTLNNRETDWRKVSALTPPHLTLAVTARCLVDKRPKEIAAYLAAVPASAEEDHAYAGFEDRIDNCMPDMDLSAVGQARRARGKLTMVFEHSALRGALAEALMREARTPILFEMVAQGDDGMYVAELFHGGRSGEPGRAFSLGFAGCVIGNNAERLAALFGTEPGSPEERAVIVAMAPSFENCVMEGQQLKVDAPVLRNQLAEATYYAITTDARP
jgi:hypothetical protein